MTNPQQTDGLTAERRVIHYLSEYKKTRQLDREVIHVLHALSDREACLNVADIEALLSRTNPPPQEAVACDPEDICLCIKALREMQMTELTKERDRISQVIYRLSGALEAAPISPPKDQSSLIKVLTEALEGASAALYEASDKFHVLSLYIKDDKARECCEAKVGEMSSANVIARKALALVKEAK